MSELDRAGAARDLDARLDAALDALAAEQPPGVFPEDDGELVELIDTARVARQLRDPAVPEHDFPERMAAGLAEVLQSEPGGPAFSANGRTTMAALPRVRRKRRAGAALLVAALLRALTIAVLAGALTGMLVGGLGGRLAMRAAGTMYTREHPGEIAVTESSGRIVGSFSWGGSIDLLFNGMIFGVLGGIAFLVIRPWLARAGPRWEGLAFGALLLLAAGTAVIQSDDTDFRRIGLPWLNVLMFGALFIGFGALLVPLTRRLERALPNLSFRPPWSVRQMVASIVILGVGGATLLPLTLLVISSVVAVAASLGTATGLVAGPGDSVPHDMAVAALLFLLVVVIPLSRAARSPFVESVAGRGGLIGAFSSRRATIAVDLALLGALTFGCIETIVSILRVLGLLG